MQTGNRDWANALAWAMAGMGSHVEPMRAVEGLSPPAAAREVGCGLHSAHRLLHHIVYWQDIMLGAAEGAAEAAGVPSGSPVAPVPWPQGPEDWQSPMPEWPELVERFGANLGRAQKLARGAALHAPIPAWGPEMTVGAALGVLITHNSYHLGQLVAARRAAGAWPPKAKTGERQSEAP